MASRVDYAQSRCSLGTPGAGSSKCGANLFVSNRMDCGGGVASHDRSSLHGPLAENKRTGHGIDSVSHTATREQRRHPMDADSRLWLVIIIELAGELRFLCDAQRERAPEGSTLGTLANRNLPVTSNRASSQSAHSSSGKDTIPANHSAFFTAPHAWPGTDQL